MTKERLVQYLRVCADLADKPKDGIAHVGVAHLRQAIAMLESAAEPTATHVAIIELHDTDPEYRVNSSQHKAVLVPPEQALEFDEGSATRKWLRPFLGSEYHLLEFIPLALPENRSEKP